MTEAKIVLTAEDRTKRVLDGLRANLGQVQGAAPGIASAFTAIAPALAGAFTVAGIAAWTKSVVEGLDALNDLQDATGESVENLSALEDIALRTGTSMNTAGDAVIKLNKALETARDPGSEAAKAIQNLGLNVEDLLKLSPVERLQAVGQALNSFDGENKLAYNMLLLGKGVKALAPLLKDLAEARELNATLTAQETDEAEKLRKEFFKLEKDAIDLSRALAGPLVSSINETIAKFRDGAKEGKSFYRVIYEEQLKLLGLYKEAPPNLNSAAGAGRGFVNPALVKPSLPSLSGKPDKPAKAPRAERESEFQRYLENLQRQLQGTQELSASETVLADIQSGRLKLQKGESSGQLLAIAAELDIAKRRGEEVAAETAQFKLFRAEQERTRQEGARLTEQNATALEKLNAGYEDANRLLAENAISASTYAREVARLQDEFAKLDEVKEVISEIDQFTTRAAQNIQDALGNELANIMEGNFKDIGKGFQRMLNQMVAQALAASIARAMFGDLLGGPGGGGGGGQGLFGEGLKFLSTLLFPGKAGGGPVSAGTTYLVGEKGPELLRMGSQSGHITPNNRIGQAGGSMTYAPSFKFAGAVDRRSVAQVEAAAYAGAQRAWSRNG